MRPRPISQEMGNHLRPHMSEKRTTNIDPKLLLLQHLYGEEVSEKELQKTLEDPENRAEYQALNGVKQQLGNRALRKHTPVPEDVVRKVFAAAQPRSPHFWSGMVRRPRRSVLLSGIGTFATCVLLVLFLFRSQGENSDSEVNQAPDTAELQWDDTRERIEMQQALSVMNSRISPDLWDESEVMRLDSLQDNLNTSRPGVEVTGSTSQ